ncbi:hypothetical protein PCE1_003811 [Barthelona sp. PCE]
MQKVFIHGRFRWLSRSQRLSRIDLGEFLKIQSHSSDYDVLDELPRGFNSYIHIISEDWRYKLRSGTFLDFLSKYYDHMRSIELLIIHKDAIIREILDFVDPRTVSLECALNLLFALSRDLLQEFPLIYIIKELLVPANIEDTNNVKVLFGFLMKFLNIFAKTMKKKQVVQLFNILSPYLNSNNAFLSRFSSMVFGVLLRKKSVDKLDRFLLFAFELFGDKISHQAQALFLFEGFRGFKRTLSSRANIIFELILNTVTIDYTVMLLLMKLLSVHTTSDTNKPILDMLFGAINLPTHLPQSLLLDAIEVFVSDFRGKKFKHHTELYDFVFGVLSDISSVSDFNVPSLLTCITFLCVSSPDSLAHRVPELLTAAVELPSRMVVSLCFGLIDRGSVNSLAFLNKLVLKDVPLLDKIACCFASIGHKVSFSLRPLRLLKFSAKADSFIQELVDNVSNKDDGLFGFSLGEIAVDILLHIAFSDDNVAYLREHTKDCTDPNVLFLRHSNGCSLPKVTVADVDLADVAWLRLVCCDTGVAPALTLPDLLPLFGHPSRVVRHLVCLVAKSRFASSEEEELVLQHLIDIQATAHTVERSKDNVASILAVGALVEFKRISTEFIEVVFYSVIGLMFDGFKPIQRHLQRCVALCSRTMTQSSIIELAALLHKTAHSSNLLNLEEVKAVDYTPTGRGKRSKVNILDGYEPEAVDLDEYITKNIEYNVANMLISLNARMRTENDDYDHVLRLKNIISPDQVETLQKMSDHRRVGRAMNVLVNFFESLLSTEHDFEFSVNSAFRDMAISLFCLMIHEQFEPAFSMYLLDESLRFYVEKIASLTGVEQNTTVITAYEQEDVPAQSKEIKSMAAQSVTKLMTVLEKCKGLNHADTTTRKLFERILLNLLQHTDPGLQFIAFSCLMRMDGKYKYRSLFSFESSEDIITVRLIRDLLSETSFRTSLTSIYAMFSGDKIERSIRAASSEIVTRLLYGKMLRKGGKAVIRVKDIATSSGNRRANITQRMRAIVDFICVCPPIARQTFESCMLDSLEMVPQTEWEMPTSRMYFSPYKIKAFNVIAPYYIDSVCSLDVNISFVERLGAMYLQVLEFIERTTKNVTLRNRYRNSVWSSFALFVLNFVSYDECKAVVRTVMEKYECRDDTGLLFGRMVPLAHLSLCDTCIMELLNETHWLETMVNSIHVYSVKSSTYARDVIRSTSVLIRSCNIEPLSNRLGSRLLRHADSMFVDSVFDVPLTGDKRTDLLEAVFEELFICIRRTKVAFTPQLVMFAQLLPLFPQHYARVFTLICEHLKALVTYRGCRTAMNSHLNGLTIFCVCLADIAPTLDREFVQTNLNYILPVYLQFAMFSEASTRRNQFSMANSSDFLLKLMVEVVVPIDKSYTTLFATDEALNFRGKYAELLQFLRSTDELPLADEFQQLCTSYAVLRWLSHSDLGLRDAATYMLADLIDQCGVVQERVLPYIKRFIKFRDGNIRFACLHIASILCDRDSRFFEADYCYLSEIGVLKQWMIFTPGHFADGLRLLRDSELKMSFSFIRRTLMTVMFSLLYEYTQYIHVEKQNRGAFKEQQNAVAQLMASFCRRVALHFSTKQQYLIFARTVVDQVTKWKRSRIRGSAKKALLDSGLKVCTSVFDALDPEVFEEAQGLVAQGIFEEADVVEPTEMEPVTVESAEPEMVEVESEEESEEEESESESEEEEEEVVDSEWESDSEDEDSEPEKEIFQEEVLDPAMQRASSSAIKFISFKLLRPILNLVTSRKSDATATINSHLVSSICSVVIKMGFNVGDNVIPQLLRQLLSIMHDKDEDTRRVSREAIRMVFTLVGARYYAFLLAELETGFTRGFYVYVRVYTAIAVLQSLFEASRAMPESDMDLYAVSDCASPVLNVLMLSLFEGKVDEEKGRFVKEAKAQRGIEAMRWFANLIDQNAYMMVFDRLVGQAAKENVEKRIRRVYDACNHLLLGIIDSSPHTEILPLIFAMSVKQVYVAENNEHLTKRTSAIKANPLSAVEIKRVSLYEKMRYVRPEEISFHFVRPTNMVNSMLALTLYEWIALRLLLSLFKMHVGTLKKGFRSGDDTITKYLKEVVLLVDTVLKKRQFSEASTMALRATLALLDIPLLISEDDLDNVMESVFFYFKEATGDGRAQARSVAVKVISRILELQDGKLAKRVRCNEFEKAKPDFIPDQNLDAIVAYCRAHLLQQTEDSTSVFFLLSLIVKKRVISKNLYDLVQKDVTELFFDTTKLFKEPDRVYNLLRLILIDFYTKYPLSTRNRNKLFNTLITQLKNPYVSDRITNQIFALIKDIITYFPVAYLKDRVVLMFVSLVFSCKWLFTSLNFEGKESVDGRFVSSTTMTAFDDCVQAIYDMCVKCSLGEELRTLRDLSFSWIKDSAELDSVKHFSVTLFGTVALRVMIASPNSFSALETGYYVTQTLTDLITTLLDRLPDLCRRLESLKEFPDMLSDVINEQRFYISLLNASMRCVLLLPQEQFLGFIPFYFKCFDVFTRQQDLELTVTIIERVVGVELLAEQRGLIYTRVLKLWLIHHSKLSAFGDRIAKILLSIIDTPLETDALKTIERLSGSCRNPKNRAIHTHLLHLLIASGLKLLAADVYSIEIFGTLMVSIVWASKVEELRETANEAVSIIRDRLGSERYIDSLNRAREMRKDRKQKKKKETNLDVFIRKKQQRESSKKFKQKKMEQIRLKHNKRARGKSDGPVDMERINQQIRSLERNYSEAEQKERARRAITGEGSKIQKLE